MATKTVRVRRNTSPTLTFKLTDFRNEAGSTTAVNITGYGFRLVVKSTLDTPDAQTLISLAGTIVSATLGTFKFDLDVRHSGLAAGTYPAEIKWWKSGVATTDPPTDAWTVDYVVEEAVVAP